MTSKYKSDLTYKKAPDTDDLYRSHRSVGFCRGSRVEGNMSRVEVEGKKVKKVKKKLISHPILN